MPYGSGNYGAVAYAGTAGAPVLLAAQVDADVGLAAALVPPALLAAQVDVDITLPAELLFSLPSELETWDADASQRLNIDIEVHANLALYPPVVAPPEPFSDRGPTGP